MAVNNDMSIRDTGYSEKAGSSSLLDGNTRHPSTNTETVVERVNEDVVQEQEDSGMMDYEDMPSSGGIIR